MPNAERSMPSSLSGDQPVDDLAANRDDDHAGALLAGRRLDRAERLPVDHGLVHRHRDVIRRLDLDGRGERLVVRERRQVERAHDDPLVGDPEPDPVREPVLVEQRLQRVGERLDVGDLAVPQDAGTELCDGAALERQRPVDGDLGGGDVAGIEVEADNRGLGGGALLEHVGDIGASAGTLEAQEPGVISRNVFWTMPAVPKALKPLNTFGSYTRFTLLEPADRPAGPSMTIEPKTEILPVSVITLPLTLSRFAW
jgi:hypothetical protein